MPSGVDINKGLVEGYLLTEGILGMGKHGFLHGSHVELV
jgi:hypothetical protein